MMKLSDLLTSDLVVAISNGMKKDELFSTLVAKLVANDPQIDGQSLVSALKEREKLGSTALESGIALPHARVAGLTRPLGALALSHKGIAWGGADAMPSQFIFLLVTPAEQAGSHLKLLAAASRVLRNPSTRERLMQAGDPAEILSTIRSCEDEPDHG